MTSGALAVRVVSKAIEALDVCTFELAAVDGTALPAFSAGSHVDVRLPNGITRQYSLCNDPTEQHRYLIGVLKDPATRGGSKAMHEDVNEGDVFEISAPKNHFPLAHDAKRSLLFAGGIGITPILCMAERLATLGAEFEMHYCSRSPERTAFRGRIAGGNLASKVQFHFDDGAAEQRLDLNRALASPAPGTHLYVCGPKGFIDAVLGKARANGWQEVQLHREFFGAEVPRSQSDASFEIKLASSGRIFVVPADKSVTRVLADAGLEIPVSCEQGVCGTCLTRVLAGVPDHKDMYLTPEEQARNDQFTPCCSRSKSGQLTLDL